MKSLLIFRKLDGRLVSHVDPTSEEYLPNAAWELERNVIPQFGGGVEDYIVQMEDVSSLGSRKVNYKTLKLIDGRVEKVDFSAEEIRQKEESLHQARERVDLLRGLKDKATEGNLTQKEAVMAAELLLQLQ